MPYFLPLISFVQSRGSRPFGAAFAESRRSRIPRARYSSSSSARVGVGGVYPDGVFQMRGSEYAGVMLTVPLPRGSPVPVPPATPVAGYSVGRVAAGGATPSGIDAGATSGG